MIKIVCDECGRKISRTSISPFTQLLNFHRCKDCDRRRKKLLAGKFQNMKCNGGKR